jgi:hypothetical protein
MLQGKHSSFVHFGEIILLAHEEKLRRKNVWMKKL